MNRLSLLMWLAIAAAVIPLLAVPLWLMKTAVIAVALGIAGTTYSLIHQSDSRTEPAQAEQKHITAGFHPQTVTAEADKTVDIKSQSNQSTERAPNQSFGAHLPRGEAGGSGQDEQESNPQSTREPKELTEDELKRQFFNTKGKAQNQSSDEHGSGQGEEDGDKVEVEDTEPINATDPNSDRFIAVNTYKSRSDRLRS